MLKHFALLIADFIALYLLLGTIGVGIIWSTLGIKDLGAIFILGYLAVLIPICIKWVIVGPAKHRWLSRPEEWLLFGMFNPVRIVSNFVIPAKKVYEEAKFTPNGKLRRPLQFYYKAENNTPDSLEVLMKLAHELKSQNIPHTMAGNLKVKDGSTEWQLTPILGQCCIEGWIETHDTQDADTTESTIRDFLVQRLKLSIIPSSS